MSLLQWITGLMVLGDFDRCLWTATEEWSGEEARQASAQLLKRTQAVRQRMPDEQLAIVTAEIEKTRSDVGPRRSRDAQHLTNRLLHEWMSAKQAALLGYIRSETFERIASRLDDLIESRLRPQEIRELVGVRSSGISGTNDLIDDMIAQYAALGERATSRPTREHSKDEQG